MTAQELVTEAKKWLWDKSDAHNAEYVQTIEACALDLKNAGVDPVDLGDTLIQQAVKLYLKAQAGYEDNPDKWAQAYEHLKRALAISSYYGEQEET